MAPGLRRERWFVPRFYGCHRVTDFEAPSETARREPCHDCGEQVIIMYDAACYALVWNMVWICLQCGSKRFRRDGGGWRAHTDRPGV